VAVIPIAVGYPAARHSGPSRQVFAQRTRLLKVGMNFVQGGTDFGRVVDIGLSSEAALRKHPNRWVGSMMMNDQ
jgi:hypothetical protein